MTNYQFHRAITGCAGIKTTDNSISPDMGIPNFIQTIQKSEEFLC